MPGALAFRPAVLDPRPPGALHDITLIADVNGNGRQDVIIGCRDGDVNLFWYENPSWQRHDMASAPLLEAGGVVLDIAGNGRPDVVAGQQQPESELYWFECPDDPTLPWPRRVIENRFVNYHDQTAGDVDGDGQPELVFPVRDDGIVAYYDIPPDPRVSPWPTEFFHLVAEGYELIEGVAVVDIDGDGRNEVLAGPNVFRPSSPGDLWAAEPVAPDFVQTRVGAADLDGDGELEIVLCEGESEPGRLAWFKQPGWRLHLLRDDLFHPHSMAIADFDGDGLPDIFVAEMGLGRNPSPRMFIYLNCGGGEFEEVLIHEGTPTHEAKVGDLTGNGLPDIIGKPYSRDDCHIDLWFNESSPPRR
jgi:hypothetical protein